MAGFGWNMRRQGNNVHELDYYSHARKSFFLQPKIACRICNQVFFSTRALINHIESHSVTYYHETAASTTSRQKGFNNHLANPNSVHNNLTFQTPLQQPQPPNPFLVVPDRRSLLNQRPVPSSTNLPLLPRENLVLGPQMPPRYLLGQQAVQIQQSPTTSNNFTKLYIDQLQKKTPDVERDYGNNRVYESEPLDLTLKL